jgi:small-conductance mechanosensitive channel
MTRALWITLAALVLGFASVSQSTSTSDPQQSTPASRPVLLAQESTFDDRKEAFLVQVEGEINDLVAGVNRLSEITPNGKDPDSHVAETVRAFNEKVSALRAKLAALRPVPSEYSQSAMEDANAALNDLRAAYSQVMDAAK